MRVIIVEDEWESREGLIAVLRMIDPALQIAGASNAEDGLSLLDEQAPDLVFLDIRMPGMNGLDMLEQIRRRFGDVCVVILSAYDHFPYAQRAIRLGVFDYIVNVRYFIRVFKKMTGVSPNQYRAMSSGERDNP